VRADHPLARLRAVVVDDRPAEVALLLRGQKRHAVDLAEIELQLRLHLTSVRGRTLSLGFPHVLSTLLAQSRCTRYTAWIPPKAAPVRPMNRFGTTEPVVSSTAQNLSLTTAKLPDHPWPTGPTPGTAEPPVQGRNIASRKRYLRPAQARRDNR